MPGLLILFAFALAILIVLLTGMLAWEMVHPPRHTVAWALARKLPSDPGELNLPFEEWWLDRSDGARLAVWEVTNDRGSATGKPGRPLTAVFVHGWGHSRIDSLQRVGPFLPLVDRIVLYDLRGHGESTGSASRLGDREDGDLLAMLERLGDGRYVLIGHSMGAVIALRAATASNCVAAIIAYGPYCEFHRSLQGRLRVNGLPSRPITDLALLVHRLRGVKPACLAPERTPLANVPLLVIHGSRDQVAPLAHAQRIVRAAPNARLVEVNDAAHADTHSIDQAAHDAAIREMFARLLSSSERCTNPNRVMP